MRNLCINHTTSPCQHQDIMKFVNDFLMTFEPLFSRKATFTWFVSIVLGIAIRTDKLGISSVVRALNLKHKSYNGLLHFFYSKAYDLIEVNLHYIKSVFEFFPLFYIHGAAVFVVDGVKQLKEARFMPGVKKLHQESDNSSKAKYIFGHHYSGLGVLAGNCISKIFCVPLSMKITEGLRTLHGWTGDSERASSIPVQAVHQAFEAARLLPRKDALLLMDRYYLGKDMLKERKKLQDKFGAIVHIVTKVKMHYKAHERPEKKPKGSVGRPPELGSVVKLAEVFESRKSEFKKMKVTLYGKKQKVSYYATELLWGEGLNHPLKFVWVCYEDHQAILATTNLKLSSRYVIILYSLRFKIESSFRELKQVVGVFAYRFWTKSLKKLNRFAKKEDPTPLDQVTSEADKKKIIGKVRAIEMCVLCGCMALGLLQGASLYYKERLPLDKIRFLRTKSTDYASEGTMMDFLRMQYFSLFGKKSRLPILGLIQKHWYDGLFTYEELEVFELPNEEFESYCTVPRGLTSPSFR